MSKLEQRLEELSKIIKGEPTPTPAEQETLADLGGQLEQVESQRNTLNARYQELRKSQQEDKVLLQKEMQRLGKPAYLVLSYGGAVNPGIMLEDAHGSKVDPKKYQRFNRMRWDWELTPQTAWFKPGMVVTSPNLRTFQRVNISSLDPDLAQRIEETKSEIEDIEFKQRGFPYREQDLRLKIREVKDQARFRQYVAKDERDAIKESRKLRSRPVTVEKRFLHGRRIDLHKHQHLGIDFYSVWLGNLCVFQYAGDEMRYLYATRKDAPLKLCEIKLDELVNLRDYSREYLKNLIDYQELPEGSFFDYNGVALSEGNQEEARKIFSHVLVGDTVLPRSKEKRGYHVQVKNSGKGQDLEARTWGQEYLKEYEPERTIKGELLGSNSSYLAFTFGNLTVAEFDQEDRATYLFDTRQFDDLRQMNRAKLLREKPEGFLGRVIHDRNWKDNIREALAKYRL
jgi:hypothetical protein